MTVYITTFFFSAMLLGIAEKKNGGGAKCIAIIGLILPICIAGFRKIGIGTDTEVYVNVLFDAAKNSVNFLDYLNKRVYSSFQYKSVMNWEIGYNALLYLATKVTGTIQGVFFLTHFVIVTFIYKGLKEYENEISVSCGMLVFYLMFYGGSLNAMRQWIAISIIFWGTHFLVKKQKRNFFIAVGIALLFHNSSVIALIIYAVYVYINQIEQKRKIVIGSKQLSNDGNKILVIVAIGIASLLCLNLIGSVLSSISGVFARYVRIYISGTVHIMPMQIIRRMPILFLVFVNWKCLKEKYSNVSFLNSMLIIDTLVSQLGGITAQSSRMGYFFSVYEVVLIPELIAVKNGNKKMLYFVSLALFLFAEFYYDNVLMGRSEIIPYMFYFE